MTLDECKAEIGVAYFADLDDGRHYFVVADVWEGGKGFYEVPIIMVAFQSLEQAYSFNVTSSEFEERFKRVIPRPEDNDRAQSGSATVAANDYSLYHDEPDQGAYLRPCEDDEPVISAAYRSGQDF